METENKPAVRNSEVGLSHSVTLDMPSTEDFGKLKGMKMDYNLTARYRTMEEWAAYKDQEIKAFYLGIKSIPNEDGELVNCAVFASEAGVFLAAQMVLVDSVKHLEAKSPVMIIYRGKKSNKTSKGSTNMFDVYTN